MRRTTNGAETRLVNKMSDPCYVYYKTGAIVLRPNPDEVIDKPSRDGISRVFHQSHVPAAVDDRDSRISPRYAQIERFPGVLGEITAGGTWEEGRGASYAGLSACLGQGRLAADCASRRESGRRMGW